MKTFRERYNAGERDFRGANLHGADLTGADLTNAILANTNLAGADLRGADLFGADLRGANLRGADLSGAKGLAAFQIASEGELVGYKRLRGGAIARLLIPAGAARCNAIGSRKCRAEMAIVISGIGFSIHDPDFAYRSGVQVVPDSYNPDVRVDCSHGIHFFLTREEAERYLNGC